MVQKSRPYVRVVDIPLVSAGHFSKCTRGSHRGDVHREVRFGKLSLEHLAKAISPEILRFETVKVKPVLAFEKWMEKRDTLNVIPMIVRYEDVGIDSAVAPPFRPAAVDRVQIIAQHPQAGTAIKDEPAATGSRQLDTRGIAAIAPRITFDRWRRAADAPEDHFGGILSHVRVFLDELAGLPDPLEAQIILGVGGK